MKKTICLTLFATRTNESSSTEVVSALCGNSCTCKGVLDVEAKFYTSYRLRISTRLSCLTKDDRPHKHMSGEVFFGERVSRGQLKVTVTAIRLKGEERR